MPNRELMKTMFTKIPNSQSKILIALWLRERENLRIQNEYESTITDIDNPFEELDDTYSPPPNEVYIEELHGTILKLVEKGTVDSKFQLDVGESLTIKNRRAKQWSRAVKKLPKIGLVETLVREGEHTRKLLLLTPLGSIQAERLYTQLAEGE